MPIAATTTFLFTDIAGSTRLWSEHRDAMSTALARHDALLRAVVEEHGGTVFKTVGDAVYAAFPAPLGALAATIAGQRALAAEDWSAFAADLPPLAVRMAVHTGVAEARDGDWFGQPLNRVARLLAIGHGGQVLVSRATEELVADHLPDGVSLRDLGEHRLKDLARPEWVFQVVAPDLVADFPALASLAARTHNLPALPNPLLGRERELAELRDLVTAGKGRLVTLTGAGGTGKTRPAEAMDVLQHGRELAEAHGYIVALINCHESLGRAARDAGDAALARQSVRAALTLGRRHGNSWHVAVCLLHLGALALAGGRARQSAVLLGAAEATADATGQSAAASDPTSRQALAGQAADHLGATAFAAAFAEGRRLNVDEAIDLGLQYAGAGPDAGRDGG